MYPLSLWKRKLFTQSKEKNHFDLGQAADTHRFLCIIISLPLALGFWNSAFKFNIFKLLATMFIVLWWECGTEPRTIEGCGGLKRPRCSGCLGKPTVNILLCGGLFGWVKAFVNRSHNVCRLLLPFVCHVQPEVVIFIIISIKYEIFLDFEIMDAYEKGSHWTDPRKEIRWRCLAVCDWLGLVVPNVNYQL